MIPSIIFVIVMAGIHVPGFIGSVAYYDECPSVWMLIRVLTACDTLLTLASVISTVCMLSSSSRSTIDFCFYISYFWIIVNMAVKAVFFPIGVWMLYNWDCQGLPMGLLTFYIFFTSSLLTLLFMAFTMGTRKDD